MSPILTRAVALAIAMNVSQILWMVTLAPGA